jgi:hypothetical protein
MTYSVFANCATARFRIPITRMSSPASIYGFPTSARSSTNEMMPILSSVFQTGEERPLAANGASIVGERAPQTSPNRRG